MNKREETAKTSSTKQVAIDLERSVRRPVPVTNMFQKVIARRTQTMKALETTP